MKSEARDILLHFINRKMNASVRGSILLPGGGDIEDRAIKVLILTIKKLNTKRLKNNLSITKELVPRFGLHLAAY